MADWLDPSTIFLVWYLIPGYLAFMALVLLFKAADPTSRTDWSKVKNLTKIIMSVVFSTLIYLAYNHGTTQEELNFLKITGEQLLPLMGIGVLGAVTIVLSLAILGWFVESLLNPLSEFFLFAPLQTLNERRKRKTTFFQEFFTRKVTNIGLLQNTLLMLIKTAFENERTVKVKTRLAEKPLSGKISLINNDLSEFCIQSNDKFTYVNTEDIAQFTIHGAKRTEFLIKEFKQLKSAINLLFLALFTASRFSPKEYGLVLLFLAGIILFFRLHVIKNWDVQIQKITKSKA